MLTLHLQYRTPSTPRFLRTALLLLALAVTPCALFAISGVTEVAGDDPCPAGYSLLTAATAQSNPALCSILGQYDTARLAGGASLEGLGNGCFVNLSDTRHLTHAVCVPGTAQAPAPSTVLTWNGACPPTQVNATGSVTITKTPDGIGGFAVTLAGTLTINSPTYGYTRQGLPLGFLMVDTDPQAYTCSIQQNATYGDTTAINNYGGNGVHIRNDNTAGYQGRATLWFPEKFYNGLYTLRCTWHTVEADAPTAWASCPGITVHQ